MNLPVGLGGELRRNLYAGERAFGRPKALHPLVDVAASIDVLDESQQETVLRAEMEVDRLPADACSPRDLIHSDGEGTAFFEERSRFVQQPDSGGRSCYIYTM